MKTATQATVAGQEHVAASLYGLQHQRLIPFVAGASIRQRVERLHIFKNLFIKLNTCERR